MGGLSIWHWLLVLVVLLLLFGGSKRLRNIGEDLSAGIKSFRKGMQDNDEPTQLKADPPPQSDAAGERKSDRVDYK